MFSSWVSINDCDMSHLSIRHAAHTHKCMSYVISMHESWHQCDGVISKNLCLRRHLHV